MNWSGVMLKRFFQKQKRRQQSVRADPTSTAACCGRSRLFAPGKPGGRTIVCSVDAIRLSCELGGTDQAEAGVVVAIRRLVPVAVGGAAVPGVVDPAAAAKHAVSPCDD